MCGGNVEAGRMVDEQWLLDLERKNFRELLATENTRARVEHAEEREAVAELKNFRPRMPNIILRK